MADHTVTGTAGNDVFPEATSDSTYEFVGLAGNDSYTMRLYDKTIYPPYGSSYVVYLRDQVTEAVNGGIDTVRLVNYYNPVGFTGIYPGGSVTASELANIENIIGLPATRMQGGVNVVLAWSITAGSENNTITTYGGSDSINGGAGNDTIRSGDGNDTVDGGTGADAMYGGIGNDIYYVDNAGDHVMEANGQGVDTVNSSVSFNMSGQELERLNLIGAASINGTGNSIANVINGNSGNNVLAGLGGNDTLDGKGGADTMQGGLGNDVYWVDNAGDHAVEANGQGIDVVNSYVSFNISGSEIENLNLRGPASINGTGNSIANVINGNSGINILAGLGGNDTLDGKEGADTMQGGLGNDTYYVDNTGDRVVEINGQGTDTVYSTVSFDMRGSEIENLHLIGTGALNGTGNSIANTIVGNSYNNVIDGQGGADTMQGGAGNDTYRVDNVGDRVVEANGYGTNDTVNSTVSFNMGGSEIENLNLLGAASINGTGNSIANVIIGNSGNNVIYGMGGNDTLTGAQGHDTFVFNTALNASTNVDKITDFFVGDDSIRLENAVFTALGATGTLAASAFYVGSNAATPDQHIIYNLLNGWLSYDDDGSGAHAAIHFATVPVFLPITNVDFVVV